MFLFCKKILYHTTAKAKHIEFLMGKITRTYFIVFSILERMQGAKIVFLISYVTVRAVEWHSVLLLSNK